MPITTSPDESDSPPLLRKHKVWGRYTYLSAMKGSNPEEIQEKCKDPSKEPEQVWRGRSYQELESRVRFSTRTGTRTRARMNKQPRC